MSKINEGNIGRIEEENRKFYYNWCILQYPTFNNGEIDHTEENSGSKRFEEHHRWTRPNIYKNTHPGTVEYIFF